MHLMRCIFLPIVLVTIYTRNLCGHFTVQNSLFTGHVVKTLYGINWLQCIEECQKLTNCISYNFFLPGKICELNDWGLVNRCDDEKSLIKDSGWIFHEMVSFEVK